MDALGRFLLRLLLVPLGAVVAICVDVLVVIVAHWNAFMAAASASPDAQGDYFMTIVVVGPVIAVLLALSAVFTLVPATVGIVIAELFAIRSWIYHAANGGLSAWIGWSLMQDVRDEYAFFTDPKIIVAAGLAAGLAYWLVAGWTAGFWKPISNRPVVPAASTRV
ncbi:MAG TPA: hypothetical protein VHA77_15755 [Xanthobacteraceae bacterium]|jgi:hypothetical protein|nr:hypothetical protein [Xanthobacteraceae bacterium]